MTEPDLNHSKSRIYTTKLAAQFCGVSVSTWRREYSEGRAPAPIRITRTRLGWRLSDLEAHVASLPRRV